MAVMLRAACFGLLLFASNAVLAAETLRVGIKEAPPFAMRSAEGVWYGISVDLWRNIAESAGWQAQWVPLDSVTQQIDALANKHIDAAIGAISMTPQREERIDFSYPYFSSGLAIATPVQQGGWTSALKQLLSPAFLSAVGVLVLMLLVVGFAVWLLEHKRNPQQFGGSLTEGIGSGFWWSAVTMTTVGYGDKAPVTASGRLLATIWMFFSVITISSFTAAIASSVTLQQANTVVRGAEDLARVRTVVVAGSTSQALLQGRGVNTIAVRSLTDALQMLKERTAEAVVYDEAIMKYQLKDKRMAIEILPFANTSQEYAIGLTTGFAQREELNRHVLRLVQSEQWRAVLTDYLGPQQ